MGSPAAALADPCLLLRAAAARQPPYGIRPRPLRSSQERPPGAHSLLLSADLALVAAATPAAPAHRVLSREQSSTLAMTNGVSSPAATMLLLLHLLVAACCWVGAAPLQQRRALQMMTGESGRDCFDGLDNDEDGLTDCEDPDCQRDRRIAQRCRQMTTRNKGPGTAGSRFGGKGGKTVKLNNGMDFPLASFGLQIYSNSQATALTKVALAAGFRNFFSSVLANNQKGFSAGVAASSVPRKQIFVCGSVDTQSCSGFDQCKKQTAAGCAANTRDLGPTIGALDMIMLDYPAGSCPGIKGQWAAFEEMLSKGRVKSLAVSNFDPSQLDCLLSVPGATVPAVNQLRFNVDESIKAIADNAKRGNILVQGWSPLQCVGAPNTVRA